MKEYDVVEVLSDHTEWSPPIPRGTKGVIVDLAGNSRGATVEFTLLEEIAVYTFDLHDASFTTTSRVMSCPT